jgi:DNA mismatch repair protein MutS
MLEAGGNEPARPTAPAKKPKAKTPQLDLFAQASVPTGKEREVLDTLRAVEVERITPLDALSLLARLKTRLQ